MCPRRLRHRRVVPRSAHPGRARPAGAGRAGPVRVVGQPGGEPARVHWCAGRAATRRPGHPPALVGCGAVGDRGRHRFGCGRGGGVGVAGGADRCPGDGVAARLVRCPAFLRAHGAQHCADARMGHLRAGHHRHRRRGGTARDTAVGLRADWRGDHHRAGGVPAGRGAGAAPLRHRRRGDRLGLPVRAAAAASAACADCGHVVGFQCRGGHHRGGRRRPRLRGVHRRAARGACVHGAGRACPPRTCGPDGTAG